MRWTALLAAVVLSTGVALAGSDRPGGPAAVLDPREATVGFVSLFDGVSLQGWQGAVDAYTVENGVLICPGKKGVGTLITNREYSDFILRLEYKLEPGGNNGVGIRCPLGGHASRDGMEIQILDDSSPRYAKLDDVQFNGSIYGVVAAQRGHDKPPGQWNALEIHAQGSRVKVTLNAHVILDVDLRTVNAPASYHKHEIKGLHNTQGYISLLSHNEHVEFRNLRIKELVSPCSYAPTPRRPAIRRHLGHGLKRAHG